MLRQSDFERCKAEHAADREYCELTVMVVSHATFCMGWTGADFGTTQICHTAAQAGWAQGGQAQVLPCRMLPVPGITNSLLGRARFGIPKKLIGLATGGVCPST